MKHTKEYAEKLAKENVVYDESLGNYVFGYMKAIEETAAQKLISYIIKQRDELVKLSPPHNRTIFEQRKIDELNDLIIEATS